MKAIKLGVMLLFVAILASCSKDADVVSSVDGDLNGGGKGNVSIKLVTPAVSVSDRSSEDSGMHENGVENEYAVKKMTLYLFNSATKSFFKSYSLNNIVKSTTVGSSNVTYTVDNIQVEEGTYDIFAIANSNVDVNNYLVNEDTFLAHVDATSYAGGMASLSNQGFVMTSRGSQLLNVSVANVQNNNVTDVTINLERVVAKIEVARGQNAYSLYKPNTQTAYAKVTLSNLQFVNLPTKFYAFRHVATMDALGTEPTYTNPANFGDVADGNGYVVDPYFFNKSIDASSFTNKDKYYSHALVDFSVNNNWTAMQSAGTYSPIYTLENTMYKESQKNAYTTGIVFQATVEPQNNVYAYNATSKKNELTDNWSDVLYYFNYQFFTSLQAVKAAGVLTIDVNKTDYTDAELKTFSVKRFTRTNGTYLCYYEYWVRHLEDNVDGSMATMKFGIVRNNLYRLSVSSVVDLGPGNPEVNPDKPDETNSYLRVSVSVMPWIVRAQTNIELK